MMISWRVAAEENFPSGGLAGADWMGLILRERCFRAWNLGGASESFQ